MPVISTKEDRTRLSLTVYNDGFGLVKETRKMVPVQPGEELQFADVASKIEVDSLLVQGIQVKEFNYVFDLVSRRKLMEKYLGRSVYLLDKETGEKQEYRLLGVWDGLVMENVHTKEVVINPEGQLILPELPEGLIVRPTLLWKVGKTEGEEIKVSYLTNGFSWQADYVVNLGKSHLTLDGWVNLSNTSGAAYENAELKLLAGDVNRVRGYTYFRNSLMAFRESGDDAEEPNFTEKSFQDYHLYTLQGTTTLKDNESKKIQFVGLKNIPYRKYYELQDQGAPSIHIEFENAREVGLGIPLPKGIVKVYAEDADDGDLELIGEDSISHTPVGEKIELNLGKAFDIRGERKKYHWYQEDGFKYYELEVEIRNHKPEAIDLLYHYRVGLDDVEVLSSSHPYEWWSKYVLEYHLKIGPRQSETIRLKYRQDVRVHVKVKLDKK